MAETDEPDHTESAHRRSSLPILGALLVVVLVIGAVILASVFSPPEENITEADHVGTLITEYVDARKAGNADALAPLLCAPDTTQPFDGRGDDMKLKTFDPPKVDGTSASTNVTVTFGDDEVEEPMSFRQVNGDWTVCGP